MREGARPGHTRFWLAVCTLALLAGAWLRLSTLDDSALGPDQSILVSVAMGWVNGGPLPLAANKSSAGIMNPPLIEYLIAAPLWMVRSLRAPIVGHALLTLAGLLITTVGAWRLFGPRAAGIATVLFAVNPWAVWYSRYLWNPNPLLFFGPLTLLAALALLIGRDAERPTRPGSRWWLAVAMAGVAASTQLHLSALALLPTLAIYLLVLGRRWPVAYRRRLALPFALGLAATALLYAPFLLFQRSVGFGDLQAIINALIGGRTGVTGVVAEAEFNTASLRLMGDLVTGRGAAPGLSSGSFIWTALAGVWLGLLIWAGWRAWRRSDRRDAAVTALLLWILVPTLLFLRHTVYLQNYYFLFVLPAPFLLAGLAGDRWLEPAKIRPRRLAWARIVMAIGLGAVVGFQAWLASLGRMADQGLPTLAAVETAIASTVALAEDNPGCELVLIGEGGSVESSTMGLVEAFVQPRPVRLVGGGQGLIVPQGCGLFLLGASDPLAAGWLEAHATPLIPPDAGHAAGTWRHYLAVTDPPATSMATWANGLALVASSVHGSITPSATVELALQWLVTTKPPTGVRYHFFNHLQDATGQVVAQDDAPAVLTQYWREGDTLITAFRLQLPPDLPAGNYALRAGLYTWPDLARIPLAGNAGDSVLLDRATLP